MDFGYLQTLMKYHIAFKFTKLMNGVLKIFYNINKKNYFYLMNLNTINKLVNMKQLI